MAPDVAILGAGNGGCAIAADLQRRGIGVSLFSRSIERIRPIIERGGIEFSGAIGEGFAPIQRVTDNIDEALDGVALIVIATPTSAHAWFAQLLAPRLRNHHYVMLNPGHTGGSLHFAKSLREAGFTGKVKVCESITLSHGCRIAGPGRVRIVSVMTNLWLAAFPSKFLEDFLPRVKPYFPHVVPAANVLETGLLNVNAVLHPPGMLLNIGWVEYARGNFLFYYEGLSPTIARIMQLLDNERLEVVRALNRSAGLSIREMTFIEYFHRMGFTSERALKAKDVYIAIQDSIPNRTITAPADLDHRYINEDVGYGLVPAHELGRLVGVSMPVTKLLIDLACIVRRIDYWTDGRTLAKMGLQNVSLDRIGSFLYEGAY